MDSYRVEKKAAMKIALADKDSEIQPVPTDVHGHKPEPEIDRLSNILKTFNEQFGTLFTDTDRVAKRIRDDIAPKVAADEVYKNAKENGGYVCARYFGVNKCLTACGGTTQSVRARTWCTATKSGCYPQANRASESPDERTGRSQVQQRAQESRKHLPSAVFQLARRTRSQQLTQNQTQVERSHMDQLPFQNVLPPPQMAASHTAGLVAVREAAFDQLPASAE